MTAPNNASPLAPVVSTAAAVVAARERFLAAQAAYTAAGGPDGYARGSVAAIDANIALWSRYAELKAAEKAERRSASARKAAATRAARRA